jgi:FlaA1/EpsC-like NDP-sugar epimerase
LDRQPQVVYGRTAREFIEGKRILVTGAGGSIGSELVRQLHTMRPGSVSMLDHDESGMHALSVDLHGHGLLDDASTVLADVRDRACMRRLMLQMRPQVVFHAAAHKHLPLLERYPVEGVKTNVLGTLNVVSAAVEAGAERFVNVSTDKAARPSSVLGATKRVAEMAVSAHAETATRVVSVRFGNVLGSRGSFLHSLASQLLNGEAVTVTHPAVTRFFMTIPEAAGLVIEAAALAESSATYVLDMGAPVRILDLIRRFAELSGAAFPEIRITGLRPGEKLHEELHDDAEIRLETPHPRIWSMHAKTAAPTDLLERIDALYPLTVSGDVDELLRALRSLLPRTDDVLNLVSSFERYRGWQPLVDHGMAGPALQLSEIAGSVS